VNLTELNRTYKEMVQAIIKEVGPYPSFEQLDPAYKFYMDNVEKQQLPEFRDKTVEKAMPVRQKRTTNEVVEPVNKSQAASNGDMESVCVVCNKSFTQERRRGRPWTKCLECR